MNGPSDHTKTMLRPTNSQLLTWVSKDGPLQPHRYSNSLHLPGRMFPEDYRKGPEGIHYRNGTPQGYDIQPGFHLHPGMDEGGYRLPGPIPGPIHLPGQVEGFCKGRRSPRYDSRTGQGRQTLILGTKGQNRGFLVHPGRSYFKSGLDF